MDFSVALSQLEEAAACMTGAQAGSPEARHAAEKVLIDFRNLSGPFPLCRYVLEHTQNAYVQFVVCQTVKEATVREWALVGVEEVAGLEEYLLHFLMAGPQLQPYVRQELLQAVAVMFKRGWLENAALRTLAFNQMTELMHGDVRSQQLGGLIMLALMNEFSSGPKSSEVGLTWEFHDKCRKHFEGEDLKGMFSTSLAVINQVGVQDTSHLDPDSYHLLQIFLTVAERLRRSADSTPQTLLRPGEAWRDVLVNQQVVNMFFTAHQRVQGDERLSNHTRQCVVQLCSLDGRIIADPQMRISYITWVMEALLAHLDLLMSSGHAWDPAETYGVSECINRLVTVCTSRADTNVYTALPGQLSALMQKMAMLSCYCLRQMPIEEDQTWFAESFDQLLEAWGSFAGDERCPEGAGNTHVTSIFEAYLQSRLKAEEKNVAEDGDDEVFEEEDDQSMYDDQLVGVATIVRWCPHGTLTLLRQMMTSLVMQIHGKDPQQIMHVYGGIHWLLLVAGHVLADSASGEKPMVPVELNTLSAAFTQAGQEDPVVEIINAVFRYMDYENGLIGQKLHGHLSPLVAKTLAWFLGCWAQTYLMPEPSDCLLIAPCLHSNYGRQTQGGQAVLERVLQKIYINLSSWGFEHDLAKETVGILLTLSKNQHVRAVIHQSPTWLAICKGFVQESMPLGSSPTEVLRELAHGCIAITDGNKEAFMHCITDILTPVGHLFESIVHAPGFRGHAQEGQVMAQIERLLDICCGVVQGAASTNTSVLFDFIQQHTEGFLSLTHIYANCPELVLAVVEIFALQAEFMLAYLSDAQAALLYDNCLRLLKLYSQHNLGKTCRGELGEEEQYEDLLLFLRLLTHLLSRDFLDFSDTGNVAAEVRVLPLPNTVQVADVVLYGLTMILPLMTEKLLQYPALCTQYFKLVSFLCEIYPEKVAHLDPSLLQAVSYSMRLGLTAYGTKIAELALDGMSALAQYSAEELQKGNQIPDAFNSTLGMFLALLFESALVEDYDTQVTAQTAEALFPLICSRQGEFQALAEQLVASQSDASLQQRTMEAIQSLLTANGLQLAPGRKTLSIFTKNFQAFLGNVRGFLRKR